MPAAPSMARPPNFARRSQPVFMPSILSPPVRGARPAAARAPPRLPSRPGRSRDPRPPRGLPVTPAASRNWTAPPLLGGAGAAGRAADRDGHGQLRHGAGGEEFATGFGQQAGPGGGAADPRAVGGDAGVGVHLPVQFGDKDERQ